MMGTAVLFPQDCLPISKSRHRNNFTDPFSRVPVATDSTFQLFDSSDQEGHNFIPYHGVGQLFPYRARNSFTLYPLQREVDRRKPTPKTLWYPRENDTLCAIPMSDVPSFTILQQPKGNETTNELVARFLMISDVSRSSPKVSELRSGTKANGTKPCKLVQNVPLEKKKKNGLNGKKGFFDSQMGDNQASGVHGLVNGPTRLKRASTDSQIVEHLGQYRSQVLQTPSSQGKALTRTTSMSLPESERWAGPAYSSSPAPSALPLPKFSLLAQKTHGSPMRSERQQSNITKPVELESTFTALGSHHANGELDVAFATRSLRRMLKLDPA